MLTLIARGHREVITLPSPDHRTHTAYRLVDGKWHEFMTTRYRRCEPR